MLVNFLARHLYCHALDPPLNCHDCDRSSCSRQVLQWHSASPVRNKDVPSMLLSIKRYACTVRESEFCPPWAFPMHHVASDVTNSRCRFLPMRQPRQETSRTPAATHLPGPTPLKLNTLLLTPPSIERISAEMRQGWWACNQFGIYQLEWRLSTSSRSGKGRSLMK